MPLQNTKNKPCKDKRVRNISPCSLGLGDLRKLNKKDVDVSAYQRLKLQEKMLSSSAKQALSTICCAELDVELRFLKEKRKADLHTLKVTYMDIKNTINILRSNISTLEKIKKLDIVQYKTSVVELEERIVAFKRFLREELELLQYDEQTLISEVDIIAKSVSNHNTNVAVKSFSCLAPSKIKTMRTTPSISPEVQAFQEFVDRSGGHDGGWGHQEHSLFIKFRKKMANLNKTGGGENHENVNTYVDKLSKVLCARIPGLTLKDVARHDAWYIQYLKLKLSQQDAIDKWRALKELYKYKQKVDEVGKIESEVSMEEMKSLDKDKSDIGLQTTVVMVNKKCSTSLDRDQQLTLEEIKSQKEARKWELESQQLERDIQELSLQEQRSAEANQKLREFRERDRQLMTKKKQIILQTQIKPTAPVKIRKPIPQSLEYRVYRQCDNIIPKMLPSVNKSQLKQQTDKKYQPKTQSDTTVLINKQSNKNNKGKYDIKRIEKSQSDTLVLNHIEPDFIKLSNSRCYNQFMRNCNFEVFIKSLSRDTIMTDIETGKYYTNKSQMEINDFDATEIKKSVSDTTLEYNIESVEYHNVGGNKSDIDIKKTQSDSALCHNKVDIFQYTHSDNTLFNEFQSETTQSTLIEIEYNSDTKFDEKYINVIRSSRNFTESQSEIMNLEDNQSDQTILYKIDSAKYTESESDTVVLNRNPSDFEKIKYDTVDLKNKMKYFSCDNKNQNDTTEYRNDVSTAINLNTNFANDDKEQPKNKFALSNFESAQSNKLETKMCHSDTNRSSDVSKCGFAAPTKEWSQRVKSKGITKNGKDCSHQISMENIPKLGQPKWRRPLSANQGF